MGQRTEFAVMDDTGILHQSWDKEEMENNFNAMQENERHFSDKDYPEEMYRDKVCDVGTEWEGELRFIEILETT